MIRIVSGAYAAESAPGADSAKHVLKRPTNKMKRSLKSQLAPLPVILIAGILVFCSQLVHMRYTHDLVSRGLWNESHKNALKLFYAIQLGFFLLTSLTALAYDHLLWKEKMKNRKTEPSARDSKTSAPEE